MVDANIRAFFSNPSASLQSAIRENLPEFLTGATDHPVTRTRHNHGFSLHLGMGKKRPPIPLGALQEVRFDQSRQIEEIFEVETNTKGLPIDLVPQTMQTRTLTFQRFDLFAKVFEQIFGADEITMLCDQRIPVSVREIWKEPSGVLDSITHAYEYGGGYVRDFGRTLRVNDTRIVGTNATIVWRYRRRVI